MMTLPMPLRACGLLSDGWEAACRQPAVLRASVQRTMIAFHPGDIPKGTLRVIMRQADLTIDDLR